MKAFWRISDMSAWRWVCPLLLALPLIVFGGNYFLHLFPLPPGDGSAGASLLQAMRDGGLMSCVALSHVGTGLMLLLPRTRFLGALLQFPITLGIVSFHLTMLPAGVPLALVLLLLNVAILVDRPRLRALFIK
jgi:hypothetical protein